VQEAELRIEADGLQGGAAVVHQHGIEERQQGIEAVQGRAPGAAIQREGRPGLGFDDEIEPREVAPGGFAFHAA
jgi:hypothetical protein